MHVLHTNSDFLYHTKMFRHYCAIRRGFYTSLVQKSVSNAIVNFQVLCFDAVFIFLCLHNYVI